MSNETTADKAAAEKAQKAKAAADKAAAELVKKSSAKQLKEDVADYTKFAQFHLTMLDGDKFEKRRLKSSALEVYNKLEKKFKSYDGNKPKKNANVFLGLGLGTRKVVKGYGVPEPIYKEFVDAGIDKSWF